MDIPKITASIGFLFLFNCYFLFSQSKGYIDRFSEIGFSTTQYLQIGAQQFTSTSFIARKEADNKVFIGTDQLQKVFFTYVLLTDFSETVDKNHSFNYVKHSNELNYLCEGTIHTPHQAIDYHVRMRGCQNMYARINDKSFDLSLGQTILIAPQKDKSLRFLQVKSPGLNSLTAPAYIEKLLTKAEVITFFQKTGNI